METKLAREVHSGFIPTFLKSLKEIEDFYYSDFWESRLRRRFKEDRLLLMELDIDIILGTTTDLINNLFIKIIDEDESINGFSTRGNIIALNMNMSDSKINDSHINNILMHELGHKQYNQKEFSDIVKINKRIIGDPNDYLINSNVEEYFKNHDEIRQRIIPIIKEMKDNKWSAEDAYFKSPNLILDAIYKMYSKDYLISLLTNLV